MLGDLVYLGTISSNLPKQNEENHFSTDSDPKIEAEGNIQTYSSTIR